ncbi:hypothetical protein LCGC14_1804600 [marine sediment metagenome]|uniref:Uncharacterized protein n=1 Tax=marine sediment metagenome TaxID=412755 RepID=A0A0F9HBH3_9ZZZZ
MKCDICNKDFFSGVSHGCDSIEEIHKLRKKYNNLVCDRNMACYETER